MIAFACPLCYQKLSIKDEFAGKRGNCPHCKKAILVPRRASPARPAALADAVTAAAPEDTPSSPAAAPNLAFLTPARKPDELGWLGSYRVLKVLGTGGMGMVLLAEDPVLKRPVALKVMRPDLAKDKTARQRFLHEAQATAAIDHPHVVPIHQVGEANGVPFIVMPLLKGEPLDSRLNREKRLSIVDAVLIGKQIAEGLAEAHKNGLVHRDVKPANVWLSGERGAPASGVIVKIVDFGLARGVASDDVHLTKPGAILGTPAYMAPEQARSDKVDFRCDLFSLGAVLYRMLTGELPFKGFDTLSLLTALAMDTPRPVQSFDPEVPPALADLVMQLLAKEPARRPPSATAVAETLGQIAGEATIQLSSSSLRGAPRRGAGREGLAARLANDRLEKDRLPTEAPEHDVEITRAFYLGATEVTVAQFRQFVKDKNYVMADDRWLNPGFEQTDDHPVVLVSWNNAVDFCSWLSAKEGNTYRLPTEAEWEFSCRAGKTGTRYSFGNEDADLGTYAWHAANSAARTHPVGKLRPNAWGLFDMNGNAWEWCQDSFDPNYYKSSPKQNPPGGSASERAFRGGSYFDDAVFSRSAFRNHNDPGFRSTNVGFRVVLLPSSPGAVRP